MAEEFFVKEYPNGLTLLGQRMGGVSSAAFSFLVPAGAAYDAEETAGTASVLAEWMLRGAGAMDTRQLNDALDSLGCQHSEGVHGEHIHFGAAQLAVNLPAILGLYGDILRRPRLNEATFGPCRALVAQDLASLEDEPAEKCNVLLEERFFPYPLGRCVLGTPESLSAMTAAGPRGQWRDCFGPGGAILAVAGAIDWPALCDTVEEHFGGWTPVSGRKVKLRPQASGETFLEKPSAQVHIGLAHAAAPMSHELYYPARMAEMVLSGGVSSRLFNEVRQKRGLVYHVSSHYHSLKSCAGMLTYAGTTADKAQETLEVTAGELRRLAEGVGEDELVRARTQLKTATVMHGESTTARAASMANDWHHLHRLRGLGEISSAIEAVSAKDVTDYAAAFPAGDFTVLVIGPKALDVKQLDG